MVGAAEVKVGACGFLDDNGIRRLDDQLKAELNRNYQDWKNPRQTWMIPPVFEMKGSKDERGQLAEKKNFHLLHDFGDCHNEPMFVSHLPIDCLGALKTAVSTPFLLAFPRATLFRAE